MFRGVEFVCCPKELEERIEKVVDLEAEDGKKTPTTPNDDDEDEDDDDDEDEYSEEDEDEEEGKSSSSKKETKKEEGTGAEQQDKYFKDDPSANEHERFREAEERLEKKHRKKVTKVITEWSELFERYNKMKEKDPKGAEQYKREM
jgi:amyloid beta A4 protein